MLACNPIKQGSSKLSGFCLIACLYARVLTFLCIHVCSCAHVLMYSSMLVCSRAYVFMYAPVLTCLCIHVLLRIHAGLACLLTCFAFSPTWQACLLPYLHISMLSMLACPISLHAHMSYMLAVLKYLICLRVCVLGFLACLICFTFEEFISKNPYIEKFVFIQRVWNTLDYLWWSFFTKIVVSQSRWLFLQKSFIIDIQVGYEYVSDNVKSNLVWHPFYLYWHQFKKIILKTI